MDNNPATRRRLTQLIQEIRDQDWSALGRDLHVTVTAAGAEWHPGEDPASLLLRAILGVKEAKRRGGSPGRPFETVTSNSLRLPTKNGGVVPDRVDFLSEMRGALS